MKMKLLLLLTLVFSVCSPLQAHDEVNRPLINVSGQAEIMVVPDEVVFNLTAVTIDKDLMRAQAKNDEVVKKVLALGQKYQVPAHLLQTGHISLDETYSDEEATKKPRVFLGYEVTKSIAIVLRDVSKAEALLADIFRSGVTRIRGVEFRSTQVRKYKDQARAMAIKAAQEKATALAREIGQSIGKAYSISEEDPNNRASSNASNYSSGIFGKASDDEGTIALGQISITAKVDVSFELK